MAVEPLILVANPGSASRKYALFEGDVEKCSLHFEYADNKIVCTVDKDGRRKQEAVDIHDIGEAARLVPHLLEGVQKVHRLALRVVAPGSYFLQDRVIDDEFVSKLEIVQPQAPLHVEATLHELYILREVFKDVQIVAVSDSAFHGTKPDYAWNYGLPIEDTDRFEIKRYGYHGLSAASVVGALRSLGKLSHKVVICHLGSGASVTAIHNGKSIDTTMGYSPLEGLVMATRSGSVDVTAVQALKQALGFDDAQMDSYLNKQSGLLGLSGSSADIRELLEREERDDHRAHLALQTYVYGIQKAIGQMTAVLGGIDLLVFTGTVGERSAPIRERVAKALQYLDVLLDAHENEQCTSPDVPKCISRLAHSRPVYVVPVNEALEMARKAVSL